MRSESVLIVGAGAVGLVVGYHLTLGGTDVTFYVRPQRRETFPTEHVLYSYDDHALKTCTEYDVVCTPGEVAERSFDFVLLTLDAATCRSETGHALLRSLGQAVHRTRATMIYCGVGVGLREYLAGATGLPPDRLLEGTLGNLSHQTAADLPLHPPSDPQKLVQADIAYRHFIGRTGFTLVPEPRAAAKDFARLYDRCGISRCSITPGGLYRIYTNTFFCYTLTLEMLGWPDTAGLARRPEALDLCIRAMRDMLQLRQFGITGRVAARLLSPGLWLKCVGAIERRVLPLDFAAFNRFHHGGKVLAQDVEVLRFCLHEGRRQNRSMRHLEKLLTCYEQHRDHDTSRGRRDVSWARRS